MNRRTLLKTALPTSLLLAGCATQSDESDTPTSTQISTIKTTRLQPQTTQRTESTTEPKTNSTTQSTTEQETPSTTQSTTSTTESTTEPETPSTTESTTPQTTRTSQSTTETEPPSTTRSTTSTTESTTEPETSSTTPSTTEPEPPSTTQSTTSQTTTSTKQPTTTVSHTAPNHPSTKGVFNEPTRGPTPFSTDATLIAFEDPSCPTCIDFEKKTYPKLKRNHIDSGELSFVLRMIPIVDEWGARAIYALEAAYARDEQAFWDLKTYYFSKQNQFNKRNVFSKTKSFINYNTQLSGRAIVRDAKSKVHRKQVQEDTSVAKAADVPGTPTFFAFRSDEYVTKIVGKQSYSIFKNVLGL
ncbi:Thioredoxin [Haladaptatus litoreus]|uniref:Thioredoxin n=1 Tax=Haladaptatus litoreus TaxID=553468 RepID=A0A1N7DID2_9EURY|nr:thioredoxin domain-containing protein [Haladaptatus litoreus]SIR75554.1 Thioredoxin [Haladaptatus litoreus]